MPSDRATRWLLGCGLIGPILFVVAFLIEGATRPDYDPAKVFVSQLSLGDQGWLQIANFVSPSRPRSRTSSIRESGRSATSSPTGVSWERSDTS